MFNKHCLSNLICVLFMVRQFVDMPKNDIALLGKFIHGLFFKLTKTLEFLSILSFSIF